MASRPKLIRAGQFTANLILRACERMRCFERTLLSDRAKARGQHARQERSQSRLADRGGRRRGVGAVWSCVGGLQAMSSQDIVCQGEPEQCCLDLVHAADGELPEAPL